MKIRFFSEFCFNETFSEVSTSMSFLLSSYDKTCTHFQFYRLHMESKVKQHLH
eukprot:UN28164